MHPSGHQKSIGLRQHIVYQKKDGGGQGSLGKEAQRNDHIAHLGDDVEGQDFSKIVLRGGGHNANNHRKGAHPKDYLLPKACIVVQKEGVETNEGIDADFGQETCKQGRYCRGRGVVRGGQPKEEGEECSFNSKTYKNEYERRIEYGQIGPGQLHFLRQVGQVERAQFAVEQTDSCNKKQRGNKI